MLYIILIAINCLLMLYCFNLKTIQKRINKARKQKTIDPKIIFDFQDNIGTKISSLLYLSSRLKTMIKDNKNQELEKQLLFFDNYILLLITELKIFRWCNDPDNNSIKKVFLEIENVKSNLEVCQTHQIKIKDTEETNVKLPIYWNRQILLIISDFLYVSCRYANSSKINIDCTLQNNTIAIVLSDNGLNFETINSGFVSLYKLKNRANSINSKIEHYFSDNKNEIKLLLPITVS